MVAGNAQAVEHRIGGGANYWTSVDDIDLDKIDDDGFSFLASYQFWPGLIGLELDLEIVPDQYGETAYAPQAYALSGRQYMPVPVSELITVTAILPMNRFFP